MKAMDFIKYDNAPAQFVEKSFAVSFNCLAGSWQLAIEELRFFNAPAKAGLP